MPLKEARVQRRELTHINPAYWSIGVSALLRASIDYASPGCRNYDRLLPIMALNRSSRTTEQCLVRGDEQTKTTIISAVYR